jgi:hypothetical protein
MSKLKFFIVETGSIVFHFHSLERWSFFSYSIRSLELALRNPRNPFLYFKLMLIDLLDDIVTYNHHMSSVYCRGWNKLVFDMADHYVQNGTHTYLVCFSVTPQKNQTGNLCSKKKVCNTPKHIQCSKQEPQSAPVSRNAAVSSSHKNVYQHKVK